MTLFQQFRLWARRAPGYERGVALVGAALVVAVAAWVLVPPGESDDNVIGGGGLTAAGTTGGVSSAGTDGPSGVGDPGASSVDGGAGGGGARGGADGSQATSSATGGTPSGGAAGPTSASNTGVRASGGSGGCVSPPGADQGASETELEIAVILYEIVGPAGNSTFGLPPSSSQRDWVEGVVADINRKGGVACRKLVPAFFTANTADASNLQQTCFDAIAAKPFLVVDLGAYQGRPDLATCYAQAGIAFITNVGVTAAAQKQFYPYQFGQYVIEDLYRNMVFGLKERGFFSASRGFKKLGFVYRNCVADLHRQIESWLNQAGVPSSQIVAYNMGCGSGFDNPSDQTAAILEFKRQGVTNVVFARDDANIANFTNSAQQQDFRPWYGFADEGIVTLSYGPLRPNYDNIANALAIVSWRYGEEKTPGFPVTAGTQRCNAIYAAAGQPPVYQHEIGLGGSICSLLWVVEAAIEHAPSLTRANVAAGLQAARTIETSYPWGPNDFSAPGTTTAGQFWRVDQFLPSCDCWQVVDREWHPSFR